MKKTPKGGKGKDKMRSQKKQEQKSSKGRATRNSVFAKTGKMVQHQKQRDEEETQRMRKKKPRKNFGEGSAPVNVRNDGGEQLQRVMRQRKKGTWRSFRVWGERVNQLLQRRKLKQKRKKKGLNGTRKKDDLYGGRRDALGGNPGPMDSQIGGGGGKSRRGGGGGGGGKGTRPRGENTGKPLTSRQLDSRVKRVFSHGKPLAVENNKGVK